MVHSLAVPTTSAVPTKVLFEHPLIDVWFHERPKVVHHRIKRPILIQELPVIQEAFNRGTEALRKEGATKWLSDDRAQLVMPSEVQHWCQRVWFPVTRDAGWRHWAIIQPESAVARLFVARLLPAVANDGVSARTFTAAADAFAWFDELDSGVVATNGR